MIEQTIDGINFIAGSWPLVEDRPTLIFIHGSGNTSTLWTGQIQGLSENFNTIAIDLPGHGKSPGSGMDSVEDYTRVLVDFIKKIKAPSPVPCGLSLGGAITLQLILENPEIFSAGIIVNSGARLRVLPAILDMVKNNYNAYVSSFRTIAVSQNSDPASFEAVVRALEECAPDVTYNDFIACDNFDIMERIHEIKAPVLILTAEEDRLTPVKYGIFLAERIKNAQREHIIDAGHMSPVEKSHEVNSAIKNFMEKTSQR